MNPVLAPQICVPDIEAHVFNGRLYVYGSLDILGKQTYCSTKYHVFSTDDLVHWTDHSVSFDSGALSGTPFDGQLLFAPDCVYKDGFYYLYFCTDKYLEGVAVSDSPWGPFLDPVIVETGSARSIDPAVFIDEDGGAYYFWDQFRLKGARLNADMCSIDECTYNPCVLDEITHGFHEGASIRKRNGLYYLVYTDISRGRATCLSYATASSPLGPYTKRGIIIDNSGCDPCTWNNHGSICEFGGQWFVFYHKSSQNSRYSRRLCIEPITFTKDGLIPEVPMTTAGVQVALPACEPLEAFRASFLSGGMYANAHGDGEVLTVTVGGADSQWASYRDLTFSGQENCFCAEIFSGGEVELRLSVGSFVGRHPLGKGTVGQKETLIRIPIVSKPGQHTFYIGFKGSGTIDIKRFWFEDKTTTK